MRFAVIRVSSVDKLIRPGHQR